MSDSEIRDLLTRAGDQVRPRVPVSGPSLRRRARRAQLQQLSAVAAGVAVIALVAGAAVVNISLGDRRSSAPATGTTGGVATYKEVSMTVPAGWQQQKVDTTFDPCTVKANTIYLGTNGFIPEIQWGAECPGKVSQPWVWITDYPTPSLLTPAVLTTPGGGFGWIESSTGQSPSYGAAEVKWPGDLVYLPLQKQSVFVIAKDEALRTQLKKAIRVPAPPRQPLVLPSDKEVLDGVGELGGPFAVGSRKNTLAALALLRGLPAVDPAQACAWRQPGPGWMDPGDDATASGSFGYDIVTKSSRVKVIVSADRRCLQAVSSAGGRVQVEANTAQRLYDLISAER